jgi:transcriptional regulator with XRE-family HTH domain
MLVGDLLERLRNRLRVLIRNGRLTERGLARRSGLSQAHIHNVLKGVRVLTPTVADRLLDTLGLSVLDLLDPEGAPSRKGPAAAGGLEHRSQPRATSR